MPRVSIITPSYNQAPFLEETIQSILGQDYPNIEYIIIDGKSTDGSQDIIRRYDSQLSYWVSEKDRGQSEAINKGFGRATGDILTWICSDDTLLPGAVSAIVGLFEKYPDAGLIYGDAWNIDANGDRLDIRYGVPFSVRAMVVDNLVPQPASFFSRAAWERFGPVNEDLQFAMDRQLWLRMNARAPIRYEPILLATMRRHPEAKGERDRARVKLAEKVILDAYFAEADLPAEAVQMKATAYGRLYYYLGLSYLQMERFEEAETAFKVALLWQPLHRRSLVIAPLLASSRLKTNVLAQAYPALMHRLAALKPRASSHA